jgi:hypothetical protein
MAEVERTAMDWSKIILPRVLRSIFWGFIMGGELLIPFLIPNLGGNFLDFLPIEQVSFSYTIFIFVGFEVFIQLLRGTIVPYFLGMARALISMIVLISVTNGGIMNFAISSSTNPLLPSGMSILFSIDFRVVLGAFLTFLLLSTIKNLFQAVNFLYERAEEPVIPPEFS